MIFASVGSVLPFDRLVRAIDTWAEHNRSVPVFIQIGDGDYIPRNAGWERLLPHAVYRHYLERCSLFVAHAGMGSILHGMELRKQTLLMPRRASLREHTTDHQRATVARFGETQGLRVVDSSANLMHAMTEMLHNPLLAGNTLHPVAPPNFTNAIASFLHTGAVDTQAERT